MTIQKKPRAHTLHIPNNLPAESWCDFRIDYESGMTLKQIGEKYHCDPRTVRQCIILNKSSHQLGRKSTPAITQNYEYSIQELASYYLMSDTKSLSSLYKLSHQITLDLLEKGYTGSERTIRNYLSKLPSLKAHFEKNINGRNPQC